MYSLQTTGRRKRAYGPQSETTATDGSFRDSGKSLKWDSKMTCPFLAQKVFICRHTQAIFLCSKFKKNSFWVAHGSVQSVAVSSSVEVALQNGLRQQFWLVIC